MFSLFKKKEKPKPPVEFHDVPLTPPSQSKRPMTEMTLMQGKSGAKDDKDFPDLKAEGEIAQEIASSCCPLVAMWRKR